MDTSIGREQGVALQFDFIIRLVFYIGTRGRKTTSAMRLIDENSIFHQNGN